MKDLHDAGIPSGIQWWTINSPAESTLVENLARANFNTAKVAIDKHPKQTRYLVLRE